MDDVQEVQEQMKIDMSALKEQISSMMEAMISMIRLIESYVVMVATSSVAAEADPMM